MHEGHRVRMTEKLGKSAAALTDTELLEVLLFNALPRVDTHPIANRLLERFGSIDGALHADMGALTAVQGISRQSASYLRCVGMVCDRLQTAAPPTMPRVYERDSLCAYLSAYFRPLAYETLEFFVLDKDGVIVATRSLTDGNANTVQLPPNDLVKLVADHAGCALVLAHNHVHSPSEPSAADDELTKQCEVLCSINNILLLDHFIFSPYGIYSYYESGKMAEISRKYHINNLVERKK